MGKKVLIVGGASAAARLRRLDENAEIILFERGEYISYANCGLPYHVGGAIPKREALLLQTPQVPLQVPQSRLPYHVSHRQHTILHGRSSFQS